MSASAWVMEARPERPQAASLWPQPGPRAASSCDEDSPLACSPGAASPASGPHQALFARELAAAAAAVAGCRLQCGDAEDGAASAPCTPPNAARPQWRPATRPAWCCAASPTDGCSPSSEPGSSSAACYQQQQQPDATRLHARHARPALHASSAAVPWPVVHSFADVASRSPLVKSALSALSMDGTHPTPHGLDTEGADERDELRWTLAQLLALHLRAGLPQATEASILAALWVLESLADTSRSSATVVLDDYLAHLAAFSPLALMALTADWEASFVRLRRQLAAAQADLLQRCGWRLRLDFAAEVLPCHILLFRSPAVGAAAGPLAGMQAQWASAMRQLTAEVAREACLPPSLHKRRCCGDSGPCPLCCRETLAGEQPGKRQRTVAA